MSMIFSFAGGDNYQKMKQIQSIKEKDSEMIEVQDLEQLDECLSQIDPNQKIVILREDRDIEKFEKIVKQEYPALKEIEIIPELFYRLKENFDMSFIITQNIQQAAAQPNQQPQTVQQKKLIVPNGFPIFADLFPKPNGFKYLIVCDVPKGLWLRFPNALAKYLKGVEANIKEAGENNIDELDLTGLQERINNGSIIDPSRNIINKLTALGQQYQKSYVIAEKIYQEVKSNKIDLNQEKVDKYSKENPQILNVIAEIVKNIEAAAAWKPNTYVTGKTRIEQEQSMGSKIAKALGIDADAKTMAANVRKGGFGLVLDAAEAVAKDIKDKRMQAEKEQSVGTQAQAFLCHPDFDNLLKELFGNVGAGFFVTEQV